MGIQGNPFDNECGRVCCSFCAGRKTGTLKFDRAKSSNKSYFDHGLIVGSNSNDRRNTGPTPHSLRQTG